MNMRLELDAADTVRVLRRDDILGSSKTLHELRDGKGEVDDIDHLGNRGCARSASSWRTVSSGLVRMERAIRSACRRSISTRHAA